MGWYGRSKFALISYRTTLTTSSKIVSKISTTAQVQHPISRIKPHYHSSGVSLFSPATKRVPLGDFQAKGYPYTPFLGNISVRGYHLGSQGVRHFKRHRWGFVRYLANTYVVFVIVVVGAGITVAVHYGVSETIPYTKRKHFVLVSSKTQRRKSENDSNKMKAGLSRSSLPPDHPESVRINKIASNILLSLQRGLKTDLSYPAGGITTMGDQNVKHYDQMLEDDRWIHGSSRSTVVGKKGKEKGSADQYAIEHLRGLNWEVHVANEPSINAFCTPWGKIIVFTGMIKFLETDAELAYVVAHEVAHAVARHFAEKYTKNLWVLVVARLLYPFLSKDSRKKAIKWAFKFSRRMELEADYIGLLLMASAGYDPRVSQQVLERMSKLDDHDNVALLKDYRVTHPSWEKRGKLVSEARAMQEALDIYREAMAGREVEGFFL